MKQGNQNKKNPPVGKTVASYLSGGGVKLAATSMFAFFTADLSHSSWTPRMV
jgi:hypothetical protein